MAATPLTKADFQTDQQVRWCPGCGDYAVLSAVQQAFAHAGVEKHKLVIVSGIGCSSRFPYYMNTFGFHTIHGRALPVATGLKLANPDLQVWVVTGDGDALSIGGNHFVHALRRNTDIKILLFNNRIYGLTKGQISPTSELGKPTKSTPYGSLDHPINPVSLALAAEATFVARSVDVNAKHLGEILARASRHQGSAFVEIYQNCPIFNDHAFEPMTRRETRDDSTLVVEHGRPLVFGARRDQGIRLRGLTPEVVTMGQDGVTEQDLVLYDEHDASLAYLVSRLGRPSFPEPIGVFRAERLPTLGERVAEQAVQVKQKKGEGDLRTLLFAGDMWEVG